MRTAGQGQAAVPGERVRRRRKDGLPGRSDLGRGRISPGLSRGVERYPDVPGLSWGVRFYHGARLAHHGFCFAQKGFV